MDLMLVLKGMIIANQPEVVETDNNLNY